MGVGFTVGVGATEQGTPVHSIPFSSKEGHGDPVPDYGKIQKSKQTKNNLSSRHLSRSGLITHRLARHTATPLSPLRDLTVESSRRIGRGDFRGAYSPLPLAFSVPETVAGAASRN